VIIPPDKQNPYLAKEIIDNESEGVLLYILENMVDVLVNNNFSHSRILLEKVLEYKGELNYIFAFYNEFKEKHPEVKKITIKEFYEELINYCQEEGITPLPSKIYMSKILKKAGIKIVRLSDSRYIYVNDNPVFVEKNTFKYRLLNKNDLDEPTRKSIVELTNLTKKEIVAVFEYETNTNILIEKEKLNKYNTENFL